MDVPRSDDDAALLVGLGALAAAAVIVPLVGALAALTIGFSFLRKPRSSRVQAAIGVVIAFGCCCVVGWSVVIGNLGFY